MALIAITSLGLPVAVAAHGGPASMAADDLIPTTTSIGGPDTGLALDDICFDAAVAPDPHEGNLLYTLTSTLAPDRVYSPIYDIWFLNPNQLCLSGLDADAYTISASFDNGLSYAPSTSAPHAFTLARRPTTLAVSGNMQELSSSPFDLSALVQSGRETPTGTVEFFDTTGGGPVSVGTAAVGYGGVANIQLPPRPAGTYSFLGEYSGTPGAFLPSTDSADVTVYQDAVPGPIVINGGDEMTKSPLVHLDVPIEGAHAIVISNSGTLWKTYDPPQASVDGWDLTDPSAGGQPTDGLKTVHVELKNVANAWSDEVTDSIVLDTTPPVVTTPKVSLAALSATGPVGATIRMKWSGTDSLSGVAGYDVEQSVDGKPYTRISTHQSSSSYRRSLLSGHTYRFRLRGVDELGNIGPWKTTAPVRTTILSSAPTRSLGWWQTLRFPGDVGGSAVDATSAAWSAAHRLSRRPTDRCRRSGRGRSG